METEAAKEVTDLNIIRTPEGMRDRLFAECRARREVQQALCTLFEEKGFSEVTTPEAEFYDLFVRSGNPLPQERMMKIVDRSGRILVLRPDSTTPIARVAATQLAGMPGAARLYYNQPVFRSDDAHRGGSGEIAQCGVELIGAAGETADFETVSLAAQALLACGLERFYIELSHVGLPALAAPDSARRQTLFGGAEVLTQAVELAGDNPALAQLRALYSALDAAGYGRFIRFDLSMTSEIGYYTGVVFRGYVEGAGQAVLSGGRYDDLVGKFGPSAPASGFAVDVDAVCACALSQTPSGRRLRIALTKGRLLDSAIELFEAGGLDCAPLRAPGRRLIHALPEYPLEAVLAKAPDVITYVTHGVCDLGVVGADTLMEQGGDCVEVLDLRFGKCRFALAVPEGSDFYGGYQTRTVATKYPNVARAFFEKKGMNVAIIKIEGSVELAPLLDLADGIVDIVETGKTLAENGLVVLEEVAPVSARLVVNPAGMKLYRGEILDFIARCERGLEGRL